MGMKKLLTGIFAMLLVLGLAGCGCQKKGGNTNPGGTNPKTGDNGEEIVYHTSAELKQLAKNAGYITQEYLACYTGLEDNQMEGGFTVELQKEDGQLNSYCVIVTADDPTAKQLCDVMQNEYTTCIRSGKAVAFPESDASADFIKMLTSIVQGKPVAAPEYVFK